MEGTIKYNATHVRLPKRIAILPAGWERVRLCKLRLPAGRERVRFCKVQLPAGRERVRLE